MDAHDLQHHRGSHLVVQMMGGGRGCDCVERMTSAALHSGRHGAASSIVLYSIEGIRCAAAVCSPHRAVSTLNVAVPGGSGASPNQSLPSDHSSITPPAGSQSPSVGPLPTILRCSPKGTAQLRTTNRAVGSAVPFTACRTCVCSAPLGREQVTAGLRAGPRRGEGGGSDLLCMFT